MNEHEGLKFSGVVATPWITMRGQNYDPEGSAIGAGNVVYFLTSIGTGLPKVGIGVYGATDTIGLRGEIKYRVAGIALEAIANNASGLILMAGVTSKLTTDGIVLSGVWLEMGPSLGSAQAAVTTHIGKRTIFAKAIGVSAGGVTRIKAVVLPWRI